MLLNRGWLETLQPAQPVVGASGLLLPCPETHLSAFARDHTHCLHASDTVVAFQILSAFHQCYELNTHRFDRNRATSTLDFLHIE